MSAITWAGRTSGAKPLPVFADLDPSQFRESFGVSAFLLRHRLADSPLFSPARLAKAAELLLHSGYGDSFKVNHATHRLGASFAEMGAKQKVLTAIDELPDSDSWIKLSNLSRIDPDYMDIVHTALQDIEDLSGQPILSRVTLAGLSVFMASPHVVTPYHIDHEANFLCQIAGNKEICLYDPNDRELLPNGEIEQFYAGNGTAARYRQDLQSRGRRFELVPGVAVHHPSLAPHWVRNGTEVSISVSIYFCTREIDRRAHVYQVNHMLRKVGMNPKPADRSRVLDSLKSGGMQLISKRRPASSADILYSGLRRLQSYARPLRAATSFVQRLAGPFARPK